MSLAVRISRWVVGAVLIWASLSKIPEPALFAQTVRAYDVLPVSLVHLFAVVVPWTELVVGVLMVIGMWTRSAALVAVGLLGSFGIAVGINIARGADMTCGCFGLDGAGGTLEAAAAKDLALIAMSGLVLWGDRR